MPASYESTDDAYVAGNVVAVTSRENATVMSLHADNTQTVKQGQLLIEMDPAVANVNMAAAEANLARTVRTVRGEFSGADSYRAQLAQAAGGAGPGAKRLQTPPGGLRRWRGVGRRTGPCPRCGRRRPQAAVAAAQGGSGPHA